MIVKNITVLQRQYPVEYPDQCPICHHYGEIQMKLVDFVVNLTEVQIIFQCAFSECKSFFIGYYGRVPSKELKALKPIKPDSTVFPETVLKLSPTFVSIYQEAEEASQLGLSQIAGPGYRKAFEFLIKDYAKSLAPDKTEIIEKTFSGAVVNEYITDPRIQSVAKRTLWLGNDETHYLRKWSSHDVNDLITLIKLAVNWIEIEQLSKHYCDTIPE